MFIRSKANCHSANRMRWACIPSWMRWINSYLVRLLFADEDVLSHDLRSHLKLRRILGRAGYRHRSTGLFSAEESHRRGYVISTMASRQTWSLKSETK